MTDTHSTLFMHPTFSALPSRESLGVPRLLLSDNRYLPLPITNEVDFTPGHCSYPGVVSTVALDGVSSVGRSLLHTPPPDMSGPTLGTIIPTGFAALGPGPRASSPAFANGHRSQSDEGNPGRLAGQVDHTQARAASPSARRSSHSSADPMQHKSRHSTGSAILPSLQIPASINDSKGSLADFAAQITCLFWFESFSVLQRVEESNSSPYPITPLVKDAIPSLGFRKWVTTILSTTQVTQNVILLALLFVSRLKKMNPTVKGKAGSEFRLLTVALMLGNKFLDDNTYTNKTWAEVSGISVLEIHIMEVEFLSNMRYSLYTSEAEWWEWHSKLGRFWNYFDRASRAPVEPQSRVLMPTLPALGFPPSLPSPPASTHASPPFASTHPPAEAGYPYSLSFPPHLVPTMPSPAVSTPELAGRVAARKRSYDGSSEQPPAKRVPRSGLQTATGPYQPSLASVHLQQMAAQIPRLPPPGTASTLATNLTSTMASLPHPAPRAMMMVYNPQASLWASSQASSTQAAPANAHLPMPSSGEMSLTLSTPPKGTNDPARRQSVYPVTSSGASPNATLMPGSNLTQQAHASPSFFLTNRNSPYRPVRRVSTLLVSPPAGAIQNAPLSLGLDQMRYLPLAKTRNDYRTGVVPYVHHDQWPHVQPAPQLWPPLPQPNFHS